MGITQAIAAMVALPDSRDELDRDPVAFQRRYELTTDELDALRRASPLGFGFAHNEHRTARLETLQAVLPRTLRLLRPTPSAWLGPYMDAVPWQTTSAAREAAELLRWLHDNGAIDPPRQDLARYETLIHELAEDPAATRFAIAHACTRPHKPLAPTDRPSLSPAARIASFDHDVTATPPTVRDRPLHLLAVKAPDRWGPRIYRLTEEAKALLLRCDGVNTAAGLASALDQFLGYGALTHE